jgi:hypothetical protein
VTSKTYNESIDFFSSCLIKLVEGAQDAEVDDFWWLLMSMVESCKVHVISLLNSVVSKAKWVAVEHDIIRSGIRKPLIILEFAKNLS